MKKLIWTFAIVGITTIILLNFQACDIKKTGHSDTSHNCDSIVALKMKEMLELEARIRDSINTELLIARLAKDIQIKEGENTFIITVKDSKETFKFNARLTKQNIEEIKAGEYLPPIPGSDYVFVKNLYKTGAKQIFQKLIEECRKNCPDCVKECRYGSGSGSMNPYEQMIYCQACRIASEICKQDCVIRNGIYLFNLKVQH